VVLSATLALLVFASWTAFASHEGEMNATISGTVTDQAGAPLDGVCVTAYPTVGDLVEYGADTSPAGTYEIGALSPGDYKVEFACGGSRTDPTPVVPEFHLDKSTKAEADPVAVANEAETVVDAQLALAGDKPPADMPPNAKACDDAKAAAAAARKDLEKAKAKLKRAKGAGDAERIARAKKKVKKAKLAIRDADAAVEAAC